MKNSDKKTLVQKQLGLWFANRSVFIIHFRKYIQFLFYFLSRNKRTGFKDNFTFRCFSNVGRVNSKYQDRPSVIGQQIISIGKGCGKKGTVTHEIGNAVGFWHEQSPRDRDRYVKFLVNNVRDGSEEHCGTFFRTLNILKLFQKIKNIWRLVKKQSEMYLDPSRTCRMEFFLRK